MDGIALMSLSLNCHTKKQTNLYFTKLVTLVHVYVQKNLIFQEFKIHSSESQEFSLSPAINATDFRFGIQEFNESSDLYCWHIDMFGCLSTEG